MKKKIIVSLVSFVILCGINYFLFPLADKLNESFGVNVLGINSFLNIILYYVLWKTVNNAPKIVGRANIFAISIAALLAISQSVGNLLIKRNSLLIWNWEYLGFSLMLIGLFFIFYYALSYVLNWMDNYKAKEKEEEKWWFFTDNARSFWLVAIALFICYLPFFISIWPGLKGWDFNNGPHSLMYQVTTGEYNAWHPIAYTLFFELFYKIGKVLDFNFLPLFEITQILLCCLTFSYLIYFLAKIRIPKWQRIIIFFFLALNPFLHMFAPAPTKDVLFMIACILLFIEMYKMAYDGDYFSKKTSVFKIIPVLFLFTVSRNNAWYSFLITIPFLLFVLRAHWIKLSMVFLTVIILFQGFNF
ncbi:MAG: DUF6020 family protein, partial [Oscillospiraceae bacterium]|nr:DUF6020 family protein [Oscillospiraceae bacterium]